MRQDSLPPDSETKTCSRCKIEKDRSCFCRDSRHRDGLESTRKLCKAAGSRKWYWDNAEHCRTQKLEYHKNNKQKTTEYRRNNKDKTKKHNKKYRLSHKKELFEAKKEYRNRDYVKDRSMRRKYGIGLEEYGEILKKQSGRCAICKSAPNGAPLHVDHIHESGEVRGLLCGSCNRAIGLLRENPDIVYSAFIYVSKRGCP